MITLHREREKEREREREALQVGFHMKQRHPLNLSDWDVFWWSFKFSQAQFPFLFLLLLFLQETQVRVCRIEL